MTPETPARRDERRTKIIEQIAMRPIARMIALELARSDAEAEKGMSDRIMPVDEAVANIIERLGEMAWGIGLPSPFLTTAADGSSKLVALSRDQAEMILEAIFNKLKGSGVPDYVGQERKRADGLTDTIKALEKRVKELESMLQRVRIEEAKAIIKDEFAALAKVKP